MYKLQFTFITGNTTHSAKRWYLSYSEADFEVFSPRRGDTLYGWGEIWRGGGHAKFHPHPCLVGLVFFRRLWAAKNVAFFVCLFVTLLNVRVCALDFDMKALEYRNDFDAVG